MHTRLVVEYNLAHAVFIYHHSVNCSVFTGMYTATEQSTICFYLMYSTIYSGSKLLNLLL